MKKKELDDLAYETLTQIAMELEASAQAAREAARCLPDKKILWVNIQQMYSRLSQADHHLGRLQAIADGAAMERRLTQEAEET
jgi:hypothetical protein